MIRLTQILTRAEAGDATPVATLTLPLASRIKSRLRVTLDDGREAGLFLERGLSLREGDLLASPEGLTVRVRAAPECLSVASCPDPLLLARACGAVALPNLALVAAKSAVALRWSALMAEAGRCFLVAAFLLRVTAPRLALSLW